MKTIIALGTIGIICTGCVATSYQKSISVTKDANGKIIQTVETESVVKPNQQGWPVQFQYLKGIQPNEKTDAQNPTH
jgi:hypothetical protein